MKIHYIFFCILFIIAGCLFTYTAAHAFFTSAASNTNNTFTAATIFPTATPSVTPTFTPTAAPSVSPTPAPGDVVINEINWMGGAKSSTDEWVELRNMTNRVIDLSSWSIVGLGSGNSSVIIPALKTISANGFFLIANLSAVNTSSVLNVVPDVIDASISLANNGEQLILKTNNGTAIDTANGTGSWFAGLDGTHIGPSVTPSSSVTPIPNKSMERNNVPGDGTLTGNWHTASTSANLDAGSIDKATPRAIND